MIKYHWNNIFHNYVTNIVSQVLEGKYPEARKSLYEDGFIQDYMMDAVKTQVHPKSSTSKKGYTLGYLGHIKKISNDLMKCSDDEVAVNVIESDKWREFCDFYLDDELERERKDLGGVRVKQDQTHTESVFDFSVEEIRSRFSGFLNPEDGNKNDTDGAENTDQDGFDPFESMEPNNPDSFYNSVNQVESEFGRNTYWKNDMTDGFSADDLLSEL